MITESDVARLRDAVLGGGLALVPTDTVYGLAAALDVPAGVSALYALKGRPRSQPCQVILLAPALLDEALTPLDARTTRAVRALLPGTTTCLVPDLRGRYAAAAGNTPGAVGLRVPALGGPLTRFDLPLVATSANDPGGRDPAKVGDVPATIGDGVAVTVDAGTLPGTASAVVDLRDVAAGGDAVLVRQGPAPDAIRERLARVGVALRDADD